MKIDFISLKGPRPENEDAHNIVYNMDKRDIEKTAANLYAIYDGHGGKYVSKYLSRVIPLNLMRAESVLPFKPKLITKYYSLIHNDLVKNYRKEATEMGSTALVIFHFFKNNKQYINVINLGDCRAIICSNDIAIPLTNDHKPNKPNELVRIKQAGGNINKQPGDDWRVGNLSVSRAFGDLDEKFVGREPDVYTYEITSRDRFIVLGCDGLWDTMDNQEVVDIVIHNCYNLNSMSLKPNIGGIAKLLAERALQKGSQDNVSVIVVFF